jgi:hypothetical protein
MLYIENVGGIKLSIVLACSDFRLLEGFLLSESSQTNFEMTTKLTMVDLVKGLQVDLLA